MFAVAPAGDRGMPVSSCSQNSGEELQSGSFVSEAEDSDGCCQHAVQQTLLLLLLLLLLDFLLMLTSKIFWAGVECGVTVEEEVRTFSPFALSETMETSVCWMSPCFTENPDAAIKS